MFILKPPDHYDGENIIPDIEVKSTIKSIREGRNELLETAIEIIRKK
jgi:hypothetical protein